MGGGRQNEENQIKAQSDIKTVTKCNTNVTITKLHKIKKKYCWKNV
jgi:hypothetical protein